MPVPFLRHYLYGENEETVKEHLVLQFDHWRSKSKEPLYLDLLLGSLLKARKSTLCAGSEQHPLCTSALRFIFGVHLSLSFCYGKFSSGCPTCISEILVSAILARI